MYSDSGVSDLTRQYRDERLPPSKWLDGKTAEFSQWYWHAATPLAPNPCSLVGILRHRAFIQPVILWHPNWQLAASLSVGDYTRPEGCHFLWKVCAKAASESEQYVIAEVVEGSCSNLPAYEFDALVWSAEDAGWMVAFQHSDDAQTRHELGGLLQTFYSTHRLLQRTLEHLLGNNLEALYGTTEERHVDRFFDRRCDALATVEPDGGYFGAKANH